jgi:hypothetical protein
MAIVHRYIDAAAGDDTKDGSDWANAWKTIARCLQAFRGAEVTDIIYVHGRGTFGATDHLEGSFDLNIGGRLFFGCDLADCVVIQSDPAVVGRAAMTGRAALCEIEFSAAVTLTSADVGRLVSFTDGADRATYRILRVDTVGQRKAIISVRNSDLPAWLIAAIGGGTATATIVESSWIVQGYISMDSQGDRVPIYAVGDGADFGLLNIRTYKDATVSGQRPTSALDCRDAGGTRKHLYAQIAMAAQTATISNLYLNRREDLAAFGYTEVVGVAPTINDVCFGNVANTLYTGEGAAERGSVLTVVSAQESCTVLYSMTNTVYSMSNSTIMNYSLLSPQTANQGVLAGTSGRASGVRLGYCTLIDLPATGYSAAAGIFRAGTGGVVVLGNCDGNNTGTAGAGLYAVVVSPGGTVEIDANSAVELKAKHGAFRNLGGTLLFTANSTITASEGGGGLPDVYVEGGDLYLTGNFNKGATNVSGGGTAAPLLKAVNSRIHQQAGTMTIATPTADWATDYGAEGAIYLTGLTNAQVGTLTGGAGGTTGVGCHVRKGAKLLHGGAGLSGVGPLILGGLAAGAWPGAMTTDLAAGVPELCMVGPA